MYEALAVAGPLLSCHFLLRIFRPAGVAERVLVFHCFLAAHIVILGYILSSLNRLADLGYWSLSGMVTALVSGVAVAWSGRTWRAVLPKLGFPRLTHIVTSVRRWYQRELSRFERLLLAPLVLTWLLLGVLNLAVVIFTAPQNGDSMTYHLARVAYYLQHGNLNYFDANFWAQVVQPKNSTLLLLYTYLASGKSENATQLVQFVSYWVAVCSVYAISRKTERSRAQSVFAAMICGLLTEWLMQATTTQNDMILTAFFGAIAYSLLAFRKGRESKYLILAALGMGLSLGTKASALLSLPSFGLVGLYALCTAKPRSLLRDSAMFLGTAMLATSVLALPSGYVDNYVRFGNPIGPRQVRAEHSFEAQPVAHIAVSGTKNLVRFGFDFLSLDGLPTLEIVQRAQTVLRAVPKEVVRRLGVDLETREATRMPFRYSMMPRAHEDTSEWGVLGFGLVWIAVFLSILGVIRSPDVRVLSTAAALLFLCQAYVGPYDPWRGRYFTACGVFAVPAAGVLLQARNRLARAYLFLVVVAGCLSAVSAVVLRDNGCLVSLRGRKRVYTTSVFTLDRTGQLTRSDTWYRAAIRKYDSLVPRNATVALSLLENSYEYPLFGVHLTRTIVPINAFSKGLQPIPSTADYLLYEPDAFPYASSHDIHLGADWYLRRLTVGDRRSP